MYSNARLLDSFLFGGFESSTQVTQDGRRLDLPALTRHDVLARQDYTALARLGIRTVRDSVRWHAVDQAGSFDWSTARSAVRAAREAATQVIWDLFHYGWPADLDIFSDTFVERYAAFAGAFTKLLVAEGVQTPLISPFNEISFLAWAGGEAGHLNPFEHGRGWELKVQMVRAAIAGIRAIRAAAPGARLIHPEPAIHIHPKGHSHAEIEEAERARQSQFQTWDMIAGRLEPGLGGREEYLDVIGLDYYERNQWVLEGETVWLGDIRYRPFSEILGEVYERYRRPMMVSATGAEGEGRPRWLAYMAEECRKAMAWQAPLEGICWYPIADHPCWDDNRICQDGLLGMADKDGFRRVHEGLAREWRRQAQAFAGAQPGVTQMPPAPLRVKQNRVDLVCLSHLRWDHVFQRPQHLMSRFAKDYRVFFVEEPVGAEGAPRMAVRQCLKTGVYVATPLLPRGLELRESEQIQSALLEQMLGDYDIRRYYAWYYTPMALGFTRSLRPEVVAYDCMDELSLFRGAPPVLVEREAALLRKADVVFTGGFSLYEAKRGRHANVHPFPSSVDVPHFRRARDWSDEPADQSGIAEPRIGYCGVIDERIDLDLLNEAARLRPEWQFVMVGPLAKIRQDDLPRRENIHYLGPKQYEELPAYMAGWEAAMMPFARNDATRHISPTKTPEYLAAGCPVVSTSIRDVVRTYGEAGLVRIADQPQAFVEALEAALAGEKRDAARLERADGFLASMSWNQTQARMEELLLAARAARRPAVLPVLPMPHQRGYPATATQNLTFSD
ncbi:MAG: glycosyltransferase family 1 protein [Bryobacteraceae bacterium]|nr:glycosyltransferase family 1 protein [Bryobacteraceae bacterium]